MLVEPGHRATLQDQEEAEGARGCLPRGLCRKEQERQGRQGQGWLL